MLPIARRHPLLTALVVLVLIFAFVYGWRAFRMWSAWSSYAPPPPVEVLAETVKTETLPQSLEATGSLRAVSSVKLSPEVAGRVVAIKFDAGSSVAAGTTLLQLYDAPERADRLAALSRVQFARLQHERSKELAPTGAEPKEMLQQREAELAQAQAAVQQLEARIAQKTIRAPFAGRIGIRQVNLGQYVNAGDVLATLTAEDKLYVDFTIPQQELAKAHVGGNVTVRTDAYPGRTFTAQINAIEPLISADTRNVTVQATLENPENILRPGLFVTASVELPPRAESIVVPATAIQTSASGDSAYLVQEGKAAVVPVVTSERIGNRVVVERGLKAGDTLITSGQLRVQPGAPVVIAAPSRQANTSAQPAAR